MNNKAALFAGALGGVAPNLFRLGATYASTSPQKIQLIPNFGAMLIFAVLGALVVWVFSGKQFKKKHYFSVLGCRLSFKQPHYNR